MEHYSFHCVYTTKTRWERDSECVEFFTHNTPLPYNYSLENIIIEAHELDHPLQNTAPKALFSNIGNSQMVASDQLSETLSNVAANLHRQLDPPQKIL